MESIIETLRAAILADGRTPYALGKASGVNKAVLSRFIRGLRNIKIETADALCRELGLELRPIKRKGR